MDDLGTGPVLYNQELFWAILAYGLYSLSIALGLPLLVGAAIALVRKSHARGTIYESHYRNLILVFFVILLFAGLVLAAGLAGATQLMFGLFHPGLLAWQLPMTFMLLPAAAFVSLLLGLWFLWRTIRGFVRVLDEKPY